MFLFVLDDLFGIKLWGENIFRRVYHHLSHNNFNKYKKLLIHRIDTLLSEDDIKGLKNLNLPDYKSLNTSILAKYEGNYSKRSTLYYKDFDEETKDLLLKISDRLKPIFEEQVHEKLEMGDSDFKAMILRYEGNESKFSMHYDAEHPDCYRALILYRGEGIVPPFCYKNGDELTKVNLKEGDGIIFKGTQTYHGVFPSGDENTVRYMLGFQYKKVGTKERKSLCSELRNEGYYGIFLLFLPYFIYYIPLSFLDNRLLHFLFGTQKKTYLKIVTVISVLSISIGYIYSNDYGNRIVNEFKSMAIFYLFVLLFTFNPILSFHLIAYFIITEMIFKTPDPGHFIK
jgi:hypothetical protein